MYKNLNSWTLGISGRQSELIELALTYGFRGLDIDIHDMIKVDEQGRGYVNILAADKLMQSPKLYATFLLWLLSELFETLPEVGDPDKPVLVFFFLQRYFIQGIVVTGVKG